jgi:hypothetical protein
MPLDVSPYALYGDIANTGLGHAAARPQHTDAAALEDAMRKTLTAAQREALEQATRDCTEAALSSAPIASRTDFETAVTDCYRLAKLTPVPVIWVENPLVVSVAAPLIATSLAARKHKGVDAARHVLVGAVAKDLELMSELCRTPDAALQERAKSLLSEVQNRHAEVVTTAVEQVARFVNAQVERDIRAAADGALSADGWAAVLANATLARNMDAVGVAHAAALNAIDRDCARKMSNLPLQDLVARAHAPIRAMWTRRFGGRWWSGWPSVARFVMQLIRSPMADIEAAMDAWERAIGTSGWWWPHEDFVVACEPHHMLRRDDRGRPHSERGPAVAWEGYEVYAIGGVAVTQQIVDAPETLTASRITAEVNLELKRIMVERYGPERYFRETGAELIDADVRTTTGGGPRALFRDKHGEQYLVGVDGSTHRGPYYMRVPSDARTCVEAHNAIAQCDESIIVIEA